MSLKITHIKGSNQDITQITHFKTENESVFTREEMYNKVKNGEQFTINIPPYPRIVAATNFRKTKYIHSENDGTLDDKLLKLPRF